MRQLTKHKIGAFFFFLLLGKSLLWAQQEVSFNQYMFLHQTINAGYAGSKNYGSLTAINRSQWVGFEGGPSSQSFSYNRARGKKNMGFAISGLYDRIGPITTSQAAFDVSYQLKLNNKEHYLGVGIKLSSIWLSLNESILIAKTLGDPALFSNSNQIEPNIGFGIYYQTPKFYAGFSMPKMIENPEVFIQRHAFFIAGNLLKVGESLELKTSLLFRRTEGIQLGYDISSLLYFNRTLWVGPQIKNMNNLSSPFSQSGVGLSFLGGVHLGQSLSLGYAYGNAVGISNAENVSSHEIFLRYDLSPKVLGILRSPRLF